MIFWRRVAASRGALPEIKKATLLRETDQAQLLAEHVPRQQLRDWALAKLIVQPGASAARTTPVTLPSLWSAPPFGFFVPGADRETPRGVSTWRFADSPLA